MVAVLEAGGLFGELGLFDDEPRSADARALTDSEVVALAYDDVRAVLQARPEILWVIVRLLAQRLRATDEALADAVFLDVPARTAKRLLELAGADDEFQLPMTQEDLAGLVGASRERVNKALAMFTRLGWVEVTGRSRYHILDREALELRAEPVGPRAPRSGRRAASRRRASGRRRRRGSASTRAQASAASSARWAGRSASCTKPCSAPS